MKKWMSMGEHGLSVEIGSVGDMVGPLSKVCRAMCRLFLLVVLFAVSPLLPCARLPGASPTIRLVYAPSFAVCPMLPCAHLPGVHAVLSLLLFCSLDSLAHPTHRICARK